MVNGSRLMVHGSPLVNGYFLFMVKGSSQSEAAEPSARLRVNLWFTVKGLGFTVDIGSRLLSFGIRFRKCSLLL